MKSAAGDRVRILDPNFAGFLGHTKIESTVRYLGVDIEDALALGEATEV